ncbi:phage terminase small subunit-related protein [Bacillus haynesii]|uniref:phage terminase small subunit-related protein n=1 Tax=Bacillus haynesii TaxID=1925021 RepID=UPI003B984033
MARPRDPRRDEAFRLWKESSGTMKLKDIADELGVSSSTVRKWKATDKWEEKFKGSAPFRPGAPKGNKNAKGNKGGKAPPIDVAEHALGDTGWVYLSKRYYRFRYVNGNLEQSDFALYQSLGSGEQDVRVSGGLEAPSLDIPADGLPVKILKTNISESFLEEQVVKAGESIYLNIDAAGHQLGVAIYLYEKTNLSVRMTYIIPGTSNYTLKGYEDVIVLENNDRGAQKVDLLAASPRLMLTNNGETDVKIKNLVVTHFL